MLSFTAQPITTLKQGDDSTTLLLCAHTMASQRQWLASLATTALQASAVARPRAAAIPQLLLPSLGQVRYATVKRTEKKKAKHKAFRVHDKSKLERFSLCDAIRWVLFDRMLSTASNATPLQRLTATVVHRYLRAFEVGRPPASVTYDIAVKLQTNKDGAVIRDRIRLPHPCSSDFRIAVVCKVDSKVAAEARADGAVAVGEDELFAAIKAGDIDFNRLLCHADSAQALMKAGLGPILGPRGLMPSLKAKTITDDVRTQMRDLAGTEDYRERMGVIRMAIGQLNFTPQMISDNIKAFMAKVKADMREVERTSVKIVDEVVLSTTNGPGLSLSGTFQPTDDKITPAHLSTVM